MTAKKGDKVKVHYTGKLDDGTIFDSSKGNEPIEFIIGEQQVIPGFENGVIGMNPGDSNNVKIACEDAYGPINQEAVVEVDRKQFKGVSEVKEGEILKLKSESGQIIEAKVLKLTDEKITIDGNHPLAGKDLIFDLELVEIV